MSSRFSPSESRSRSSAPAKTVQVELIRTGRRLSSASGPELVQAHVHLVGDVPEVAPAAGGAPVVHLEARDDPGRVDLDRLGVLPADVEDGPRRREEHVGAEAVAEDLGADLLLRERQARAPVARADRGRDRRGRPSTAASTAARTPGVSPDALERLADVLAEAELERLVLDLDDALVVEADEEVERDAGAGSRAASSASRA